MKKSILYATHIAFRDLMYSNSIFNVYAYVYGNKVKAIFNPIWKIKTKRYHSGENKNTFDALKFKYVHNGKEVFKPLVFNFGFRDVEHCQGVHVDVIDLQYEYELEREVVERICKISDEGYDIVSNGVLILGKNKGSQLLMNIDLQAPDYSYMDETVSFPF